MNSGSRNIKPKASAKSVRPGRRRSEPIVIIGAGSFLGDLIQLVHDQTSFRIIGILDPSAVLRGQFICEVPVLGWLGDIPNHVRHAVIGTPVHSQAFDRGSVFRLLQMRGFEFPVLKAATSRCDQDVILKMGTCLLPGCTVKQGATLGLNTLVGRRCRVEAGIQLEDHRVMQFGASAEAGQRLKSDAVDHASSQEVLAYASDSIQVIMKRMNSSRLEIILVVDDHGALLGTVTDGDIRRGILAGIDVEQPVSLIMNPKPVTVCVGTSEAEMLGLMRKRSIRHLPIVDGRRHLVGLERLEVLVDKMSGHNAVVMAGGLGTRLKPLTDTLPKPLIPVCGRPILDHILDRLHSEGVDGVVLSLNHLGDQIKEHIGDGAKHGIQVDYLTEKKRLGTAGALSLLDPLPSKPFIVMNGDLLTGLSFSKLLQFQVEHDYAMVICVRRHNHQVPYGVVDIRDGEVTGIREKPVYQHFINAGIYVMSPACLNYIPKGEYCDMPDLIRTLVEGGKRVGVFPIIEYWRDLGTHADLAAAEQESRVVELPPGVWAKARPVEVQK